MTELQSRLSTELATKAGVHRALVGAQVAGEALNNLSRLVRGQRMPPSGTYAFFHHVATADRRVRLCALIVERFAAARVRMLDASALCEAIRVDTRGPSESLSTAQRVARRVEFESHRDLELDFESLYSFGAILLDQWAIVALRVGGIERYQHPYRELYELLSRGVSTPLQPLWQAMRPSLTWVEYRLRMYRNTFIVHADRPWQHGTVSAVFGTDFQFFTPTPVGWLDDDQLNAEIKAILPTLSPNIREALGDCDQNPASLIEGLLDRISDLEPATQKAVAQLARKKGGSTPTFQHVAERLFEVVGRGTSILATIAGGDANRVALGLPYATSNETQQRLRRGTPS